MGGCHLKGHLYTQYICMPPVFLYPLYICTPHTSVPPYPKYICMFSVYHMFPICHGDLRASVHPICLGVFWGASVHPSGILVAVCTSICPLVHNSDTCCSPSLWVASLLDWILWMSALLHAVVPFFTFFIMAQGSTTMAMTTTPLVTVVFSSTLSLLSMVTPFLMGLSAT